MARDGGTGFHGGRQAGQRGRALAARSSWWTTLNLKPERRQRPCWWCRWRCWWRYGLLRLSTSLFTELRELVFAKATEGAARASRLQVFRHLHALSLRFHLERQTGGMTRDIERGTRGMCTRSSPIRSTASCPP